MDKDDEFLHGVFTYTSQLCFEKAKEHIEKEREVYRHMPGTPWTCLLAHLLHLVLAEKSYIDIGFLQNKNKGFLRKDNSLKSVYEQLKRDIRNVQDNCRQTVNDKRIANYSKNLVEFIIARIALIELYEKIYISSTAKCIKYGEILILIQTLIQRQMLCFTDITLTPVKAIYSLECEILEQLMGALVELQRLKFLPSLALIYGAHTRLSAWESKMQNRESWKLGFLKNTPLPALFQWLVKFKGTVISKFSLYFHDTLAKQTSHSDMRQQCSKLQHDHYQKIVNFQRKYDAVSVLLLTDYQLCDCDKLEYENFPVIISYPAKCPSNMETILKMIAETQTELEDLSKIIYKYSSQDQATYVLTTVEPSIYMVLIFENKKTEKEAYIANFIQDLCVNLRCSKIFISLKPSK